MSMSRRSGRQTKVPTRFDELLPEQIGRKKSDISNNSNNVEDDQNQARDQGSSKRGRRKGRDDEGQGEHPLKRARKNVDNLDNEASDGLLSALYGDEDDRPASPDKDMDSIPPSSHKSQRQMPQTDRGYTESDPVIELWYADSYQRHQPNLKGYEQWCRSNLATSIHEQGLSINRVQRILSWLIHCRKEGFRPLGSPQKRGAQKKGSKRRSRKKQSAVHQQPVSKNDVPVDHDQDSVIVSRETSDLDIEQDTDGDNASMVSSNIHSDLGKLKRQESITSTPEPLLLAGERLTSAQYQAMSDEEKIQTLKERIKVFDVVYGQGQPKSTSKYWDEKLDYMSPVTNHPRSRPKGGFRTQCHRPLQVARLPKESVALHNNLIHPNAYAQLPKSALNHGLNFNQTVPHSREVLTEDPSFGITTYPPNETETPEGLEDYNSARQQVQHRSLFEIVNDTTKTAEEIREEEAAKHEAEIEAVRKAVAQKYFDWETPDAMKGLYVDVDRGETKFNPRKFGSGVLDNTWQKIQARCDILNRGGEEADRLIEEEAVEAKKEMERQKRRQQNQRLKMNRLERSQ